MKLCLFHSLQAEKKKKRSSFFHLTCIFYIYDKTEAIEIANYQLGTKVTQPV